MHFGDVSMRGGGATTNARAGGGCLPSPMLSTADSPSLGPARSEFLAKMRGSNEGVRHTRRAALG